MNVWIDINHIPQWNFYKPLVETVTRKGHCVWLTVLDRGKLAKIPHLQHFVTDDLEAVCRESDVLVVTNKEKEFAELLARWPGKTVVDLVRQWKEVDYDGRYEGLSWGDINANRHGQESSFERDFRQTEF